MFRWGSSNKYGKKYTLLDVIFAETQEAIFIKAGKPDSFTPSLSFCWKGDLQDDHGINRLFSDAIPKISKFLCSSRLCSISVFT